MVRISWISNLVHSAGAGVWAMRSLSSLMDILHKAFLISASVQNRQRPCLDNSRNPYLAVSQDPLNFSLVMVLIL